MIKKVAVIGSGTMGAGIAQAVVLAGYGVVLYDVSDEILAAASPIHLLPPLIKASNGAKRPPTPRKTPKTPSN
jgi:glycerol-3-phosphate dehydrogenase